MNTSVSLVDVQENNGDLKASIASAFDLVNFRVEKTVKTVVIKPNLNYYWDSSTGSTTDPQVIGSLIDYLRDQYGENIHIRIAEADATAMKTKHAFKILGYDKLAISKRVELFNLCTDEIKRESISINGVDMELDIPQSLVKADLFINVPKLKTIRVTKVTCAMKNLFGCLGAPRKYQYHSHLDETIVGVNKLLHPHVILVDGLIGLGRYPVKLNLLMAGLDCFSVDWIAARIVGSNPKRVKFLKLAIRENLGNPKAIALTGKELCNYKSKFPREGLISQNFLLKIEFGMLGIYNKIVGDVVPPFLEES